VKGDFRRRLQSTLPLADAETLDDEVHHFPSALGKGVDRRLGALLELQQVAVKIHGCAGTAGNDHGKIPGEDRRRVSRHFSRCLPVTGIEGRLATTGLVFRKNNFHAQMLQYLHGGAGHIVIKRIAEAGAHEQNFFSGGS